MQDEGLEVIVVDDFLDAAQSLAQVLEIDGYRVRVATGGAEALELVKDRVPNCVILDINMPGMDGGQLAQALRDQYGTEMVLVAMTGFGDDSERVRRALKLVDHFLKKPVDLGLLKKVLRPTRPA